MGPFHLDDLNCTGDEQSLFQCSHNGLGIHDCGEYDDASVLCYIGKKMYSFYVLYSPARLQKLIAMIGKYV